MTFLTWKCPECGWVAVFDTSQEAESAEDAHNATTGHNA